MAAIGTVQVEVEIAEGAALELCYAILTRSPAMSFVTDGDGVSFPQITLPRREWDAILILANRALVHVKN